MNKVTKIACLTRPTCPKYNPGKPVLTAPDSLNCLMSNLGSGKWISYSFFCLMDINIFQSWSICFHTGLKPSLKDRLLLLMWLKSFWKRLSLPGEALSNIIVIKEPFYLSDILTSVHYLVSFTTLSLCLPPLILWFSLIH